MKLEQEKLRANLLRSISHDLRTPLTSISGNAGILMRNYTSIDESHKRKMYSDIYDD
ncbi:MAG: histidine kinase dimerization/phospho-acceptor domain-containing protein [Inconstantimicrobium porci]|uniref:histidine kinase dimerization/phospho-acceptor domain-containing protein n=1 Tax=Inconstantimicrobium porci TaxID=2652291 RepID=UPI002A91175C|nr:histidine kinase dimerization/phospho-acceptor domain-containing protein [Inconstantimicrobium porci]MDY5913552.1 histidine kinase dimerization/phospho-acceptor domain-containing protein [Inconstantimicrobium porci]